MYKESTIVSAIVQNAFALVLYSKLKQFSIEHELWLRSFSLVGKPVKN